ncbi:MAG: hypothetical protein RLN70_02560 [Rhodospirillaceae bacterium]
MRKQSGPAIGVKSEMRFGGFGARAAAAAVLVQLVLAACGTTWHHPNRSGARVEADERACAREAENTVLLRTNTPRTEYGRSSTPTGGATLGETPMELHDRSQTTTAYRREFESCMRGKGYSKD